MELKIITKFQIIEIFIKDIYLLKVTQGGNAQNKIREVVMAKKNKVEEDDEIIEENELDGMDDEDLESNDDLDDSEDDMDTE